MDLFCCAKVPLTNVSTHGSAGFLQKLFEKHYTPFILSKSVLIILLCD